jgi:hypothetical protein
MSNPSHSLPGLRTRPAHGSTSLNTRFSMNRRDMMKLVSLVTLRANDHETSESEEFSLGA